MTDSIGEALARGLSGKTVLVTGASSGLGAHFARLYAGYGAHVVLTARRTDRLDALQDEISGSGGTASAHALDVLSPDSIAALFSDLVSSGHCPDVVINNAGVASAASALDVTDKDWNSTLDTNLTGVFRVAQAAAKAMAERGQGGSIVNIASILGLRVSQGLVPYSVSKAGVVQMTKALALEWARHAIRVNAVAPGYFETEINSGYFETEAGQAMIKRIPQRRIGNLAELDGVMLLLASDASSYMTGSVLAVDGGHLVSGL
ncbi:SDR family NAD(P)-dependent oxidoreductase [Tepidamorphus sp. 3E244]|uniref:SDR family NAD(P)-dependent oxidoreductase n=1 Tax=Tepidamorphus sp. 3E244 TaxID=3385498 RepID=UPI0038FC8F0F